MKKCIAPLNQNDLEQIVEKIAVIMTALSGGDSLRPQDRQTLVKSGRKTVQFVQQALDISQQNPSLVPQYVDLAVMQQEYTVYNQMLQLLPLVDQLKRRLEDLRLIAGSNSYISALRCYKGVKNASQYNIVGAQPVYDALKTRFKPVKRKPGPVEPGANAEEALS